MNGRRSNVVLLLSGVLAALLLTAVAAILVGAVAIDEAPRWNGEPLPPPAADGPDLKGPPYFREVQDSGIDFTYHNGEEAGNLSILEALGGGVALLDYDGDGLLDVFVPGGGGFDGPDGKTIVGKPSKLYRNLGNLKFQDVTADAGLADFPWFYTHGAAVADYDRDGWPDLLVTGWGRVALFHNEPVDPSDPKKGRKFVDVTEKAGLTGITWATSAAWADFDGDGYPDLYICQYVDWSFGNNPVCGDPRDVCPPQYFSGLPHKLFANKGDGTFRDVSAEVGLRGGGPDEGKGLAVLAVDVNGDGKPDVYAANDKTGNLLYINRSTPGHLLFDEVGVKSGAANDERGVTNGSMGLDAADYDGCGRPSLWVTNFEREEQALYHNDCTGDRILFRHCTIEAHIGVLSANYVAWGTSFLDLERRGWEDIVFVNGHVYMHPAGPGRSRRQKPVLLHNQGDGTFRDYSSLGGSYFQRDHLARGAAFGDLDNDGRTDIIISHINEPAAVLQNVAKVDGTHWLGIELIGTDHADVVGAKIRLEAGGRVQTRFAKGGGSYASSGDRRCLFGLGAADTIEKLTVTWPNLETERWAGDDLPADHYYRLVQGQKRPERAGGR